jgi:membrane-bound acyltransferase YfiQ involved in biofilm formation
MAGFVVIIVVTFSLFFKYFWGLLGLPILLYSGFRYLIYLVRMAFLFFKCGNRFLLRCDPLRFLRSTPEIII